MYNEPNVVNIDYDEKHFSSHSNTRDDEEILNIDRSKTEEAIKKVKHRKVVEHLEGAEALRRLFREIWEHEAIPTE